MTLSQLYLTSLFLLGSGLLIGGWLTTRGATKSSNYWPLAWAALLAAGGVRVSPLSNQLDVGFAALFAAFMLAGSLQYAGRPVPRYFLAASASFGAFVTIASSTEWQAITRTLEFVFNLLSVTCSAALVHRAAIRGNRPWFHKCIGPGLLVMAIVIVTDYLGFSADDPSIEPWLFTSIPLATIQIVALVDRAQSRVADSAAALEQSASLLMATLDSTADGILVVGRNREIMLCNDRFREMWLVPRGLLEADDGRIALAHLMSQLEEPEALLENVEALVDRPMDESFDTLDLKDGRVFERYSRPQYLGEEIVGRAWSFRNVTERVRAERIAARNQSHLAELVEERTQELVESRDRLRKADRLAAVGTLAAGVAHQINNPIGLILNSAEYALLCAEDSDSKETFKHALEVNVIEAKRCADIVRSMLQFARDQAVEMRVEDLNSVVRRACRATEYYARDNGAELTSRLIATSLPVRMCAIEIEQVVVNIIRNAVESRETGARVEVRTEQRGDLACVYVSDNGRGISTMDSFRVFDPFYSTRLQRGGTGLGLSVAHGIVSEHDGEITAKSGEGKGTVFLVELPLCGDDQV